MSRIIQAPAMALALGLSLAAASPAPSPSQPPAGWNPCGALKDPRALWECWGGRSAGQEGLLAATCVAKTSCPAKDQNGKPVLNCYYESDYKTGWHCILFCNYGGNYPWGSDGGTHCD